MSRRAASVRDRRRGRAAGHRGAGRGRKYLTRPGRDDLTAADRFGLDARAIQDWEQGRRVPDRAARVLLTVIDRDPEAVIRALTRPAG